MCTSEKVSRVADAVLQLGLASLLAGVAGGAIVAKAGDAGINHPSATDGWGWSTFLAHGTPGS